MRFPRQFMTAFEIPPPESPQGVAFELFKRIATPGEVQELIDNGGVVVPSKRGWGDYVVTQRGATGYIKDGVLMATGCLETAPHWVAEEDRFRLYPPLDIMIANYLVLKSNEEFYWRTACIHPHDFAFVNPVTAERVSNLAPAATYQAQAYVRMTGRWMSAGTDW